MKLKFYKERVTPWKICKKCGVEYRPPTKRTATLGLCYVHRKDFAKEFYQKYGKKWQLENWAKVYEWWKDWVKRNPERRRQIALESYHRNKDKPSNKARKHRATKKPI